MQVLRRKTLILAVREKDVLFEVFPILVQYSKGMFSHEQANVWIAMPAHEERGGNSLESRFFSCLPAAAKDVHDIALAVQYRQPG